MGDVLIIGNVHMMGDNKEAMGDVLIIGNVHMMGDKVHG